MLFAQETSKEVVQKLWQNECIGNLNFTQNYFNNWQQGGDNAWSWQLDILPKLIYTRDIWEWTTSGKLAYGKSRVSDFGSRKSTDEIRLESVLSRKVDSTLAIYLSTTGLTQFTKGHIYENDIQTAVSDFMDPGFFTQSIGIYYTPNAIIQTRLGPALKETITKNHPTPYSDDSTTEKIEKTKIEFGAESITDLNVKLNQIILWNSKLEIFTNLEALDAVDINWDNMVTAKIAKYINVSLNFRLFYDKDISLKRQLKQVLAVGVSYTLLK